LLPLLRHSASVASTRGAALDVGLATNASSCVVSAAVANLGVVDGSGLPVIGVAAISYAGPAAGDGWDS